MINEIKSRFLTKEEKRKVKRLKSKAWKNWVKQSGYQTGDAMNALMNSIGKGVKI